MNANQAPWKVLRASVAAADSTGLLTTTNSNWHARPEARGKAIPQGAQALLITFIGDHASDPEDGTATVKLTAYRSGGPAQVVGTYTVTIGGQKVVTNPVTNVAEATAKYAETIAETSTYWITPPEIVGALADNVACLALKVYGAAFIVAEVTALSAGLTLDILMSPIDQLP
jgi:hypothetical protein